MITASPCATRTKPKKKEKKKYTEQTEKNKQSSDNIPGRTEKVLSEVEWDSYHGLVRGREVPK